MSEVDDDFEGDDAPARRGPADDEAPKGGRYDRIKGLTAERNTSRGRYLAEKEKREAIEAELETLRKAGGKAEDGDGDDLDKEIAALDAQVREQLDATELTEAHETGLKLNRLLARKEFRDLQRASKSDDDGYSDDEAGQQSATPASAKKLIDGWVSANAEWFVEDGPQHDKDRRQAAIELEASLKKDEGFMANDPELYAELDKRLAKKFAKREDGDEDDIDDDEQGDLEDKGMFAGDLPAMPEKPPEPVVQPVASSSQGDDGSARSRVPGRLRESDKEAMRLTGLNPNDPAQRASFLKYRNK